MALRLSWNLDGKGENFQDKRILSLWIRRHFSVLSNLCTTSLRLTVVSRRYRWAALEIWDVAEKGAFLPSFLPSSTSSLVLVLAVHLSLLLS